MGRVNCDVSLQKRRSYSCVPASELVLPGATELQPSPLGFKQDRRDPTQDGVGNPPWERAARSQPLPDALCISPGLRHAVFFLFLSVFSSSPFGCRLTSAATPKFATGLEFDSAKGAGGTGPCKKYCQEVNM